MSNLSKSLVITPEIQQLFTKIYLDLVFSLKETEDPKYLQQLQTENRRLRKVVAELDRTKAELVGIRYAFQHSQQQVNALASENKRLKKLEEPEPEPILPPEPKESKPKVKKPINKVKQHDFPIIKEPIKPKKPIHPWERGTVKIQKELVQAGVLSKGRCDKIKESGTKVTGADGSTWEFLGRNRAYKNAKLYRCIG